MMKLHDLLETSDVLFSNRKFISIVQT